MNYVRKLGFEENPDYDFLRELFTKVLKTLGEPEDGIYDWMMLNNGKGWEASNVCFFVSKFQFLLTILSGPLFKRSGARAQAGARTSLKATRAGWHNTKRPAC